MAKTSQLESVLGGLMDRLADRVADLLGAGAPEGRKATAVAAVAVAGPGRKARRAGRKLDMSCRVAGCKNKSRGPRFGFICDDHLKSLSKKEQVAARDAWKAKRAA